MSEKNLIQCSKEILGGTPVFAGTRVPVQSLIDYFEEGKSLDEFLQDFPTVGRERAVQVLECVKKDLLRKRRESAA